MMKLVINFVGMSMEWRKRWKKWSRREKGWSVLLEKVRSEGRRCEKRKKVEEKCYFGRKDEYVMMWKFY